MPEQSNLEKIHPKFANEHQCFSCGGYFLDEDKSAVQCKRCIRNRRKGPIENAKDLLHKDVNVTELSKKVAELEALVERLTKDETSEKADGEVETVIGLENKDGVVEKPKLFKPKKCSKCDKEFTPGAAAQKICHSCRELLIK